MITLRASPYEWYGTNITNGGVLYPAGLLNIDQNNTSDLRLTNMLQLLQSLDNDGNPYNGINIDENISTNLEGITLNLDSNTTTIEDINSTVLGLGLTLVPKDYAIAHYEDTLRKDLNITVDTVPPAPAIITQIPSETYADTTPITINGEVGAQVWIDGFYANTDIDSNNSATIDVNTSNNTDTNNTASIVLKDGSNRSSTPVVVSIFRPSNTTLNARDIARMKTQIEASSSPRAFVYTPIYNTGDDYNITFSENRRTPTVETQTYNVTATLTKGTVTDSVTFTETVPYSQDLRDSEEVDAIQAALEALTDKRSPFSYAQKWNTGSQYNIVFSEPKRIPTAIDQSYTVTITKGSQERTIQYTEFVPTTNVKITLGDGTTTLINDEYADAYTVTNGGIFQKVGLESQFIGTAFSVDASQISNLTSSNDLLNYLINNSNLSGITQISLNNAQDGSLVARYEITAIGTNLYELLESLLGAFNYSIIDNIDLTQFEDVNSTIVDLYVEYDTNNDSYMIVTLTDKTIDVNSDIAKIVNKDSIVQTNETIVNEQETFTMNSITPKGDFLFVMDDSESMSEEQAAAVEAIERTFAVSTTKYGLDWKATVIGTGSSDTYSSLINDPVDNNITKLSMQLALGTNGSGDERGLKRAYYTLNGGYVTERNASNLSVIYISDEVDHSTLNEFGETDDDYTDSYFVNNDIKYNIIVPTSFTPSSDKAVNMYLATQGSRANLTNYTLEYNQMMDNVIKYAAAKSSPIKLSYPALASSITVHVDGVKATAWEYDANLKAIVFDAAHKPADGAEVVVTYSHLDYTDVIAAAVSDFDTLPNEQKRTYINNNLIVTFDPVQPLAPLADTNQTYDVTATFEMFGYSQTTTFEEVVLSYVDEAKIAFDALAVTDEPLANSTQANS